jgi:NADH-quinone oxidoreductase subunit G
MYQKEIGGPLRGGDAGVRLFEPAAANGQPNFSAVPPAFKPREGEWLLLPMFHIFGSDELSLSAPGISELAAKPHVAVNTGDFAENTEVEVSCSAGTFRLPVRIHPEMPAGVAALSVGSTPLVGIQWPAWGKISRTK